MTNNEKFGLSQKSLSEIVGILRRYPEIYEAKIFGSRAMDNYKKGSDIDIALFGEGISLSSILKLKNDFEESSLPYFIDIIKYDTINNADLKKHIDQNGIPLFEKTLPETSLS